MTTRASIRQFWSNHRTLFWTLHSVWALATGVAVIVLAREKYGFVPWVAAFLALTWVSTLFFGRRVSTGAEAPGLGEEATSYLTRIMYQETLFFLLPFYAYSTVLRSPNALFLVLLGTLGVLSCLDLLFDRWLRSFPAFGLLFFALVTFSATNLLLPILLPLDPTLGTRLAVGVAVLAAVPLALSGPGLERTTSWTFALAGSGLLAVGLAFPQLVPPVPLRLESAVFSSSIDRNTLAVGDTLRDGSSPQALDGAVYVLLEVFAPSVVPTSVSLEWTRNGEVLRSSREVAIAAHEGGFRVWDGWRPPSGEVAPGDYRVKVRARGNRVFGITRIRLGQL